MNTAYKLIIAFVIGNTIGMVIGPISVISINARNVLRSQEDWPDLNTNYAEQLMYSSIPAEINGMIGCCVAIFKGDSRRKPVLILPIALHILAAISTLCLEPQSLFGFQMYTLIFTVVIYSSGRLGQHIALILFSDSHEIDSQDQE